MKRREERKKDKVSVKKQIKKGGSKKKTNKTEKHSGKKSKDTWYELDKVIDWVQQETGHDLRTAGPMDEEALSVRNEKLFPLIKEKCA